MTSKDRPSAASQAAKTSKMIGIILAKVKCEFVFLLSLLSRVGEEFR